MSRWVLDTVRLADAVETVRRHRGVTAKVIASEMGLSDSTLTRLKQGHKPDADGLVSVLAWLNADAREFTRETP